MGRIFKLKRTLLPFLAAFLLLFQSLAPTVSSALAQEESDTTPPTDPGDVHSISHEIEAESQDNIIHMGWSPAGENPGATDSNSGVDGYSTSFTQEPEDLPDEEKDLEEDATGYSEELNNGSWYFHLRTLDNAGNWTSTVHMGPYVIDTTEPQSTLTSPSDDSVWGSDGIYIEGSSTDIPQQTVSYVTLHAYSYDDDEWFEITTIENENEDEPFNWSYTWVPDYEGNFDIVAEATDKAGNTDYSENAYVEYVTYDITPPESQITSPQENSSWNSPIPVEGNSQDSSEIPVDSLRLFYAASGEVENAWTEIDTNAQEDGTQPLFNEFYDFPFYWSFYWTPAEEGTYDIKVEATDQAGNIELSPVVEYVTYDLTIPASDITDPQEGQRYIEDVWDGEIRGTAEDNPSSGVNSVLVSIQRDFDGAYWNADDEDWIIGEEEEEEYLNEAEFDEEAGNWTFPFDFIEPEGEDEGYTVRSHAVDNAGNQENTSEVHFFFGKAPNISTETSSLVTSSSLTITWDTDFPATSRVVYDTVSHLEVGEAPNYGYANSTSETDVDPKVTSHSVSVTGLTAGTTYYYRTVSRGSPEAVSQEHSFATAAVAAAATSGSNGDSGSGASGASAPTCGNPKPGGAPTLTGASTGTNQVTLTWSPAAGPVTYYLVTYGTSPGAQEFGNPNVGGSGTSSYTISGLSGGTTYFFKVRAGNGCAPGDFSNELSATPSGGFVAGPAAGFTPGVLAEQTEATKEASPPSMILAEKDKGQEKLIDTKKLNWLAILAVAVLGVSAFYWFILRRKS